MKINKTETLILENLKLETTCLIYSGRGNARKIRAMHSLIKKGLIKIVSEREDYSETRLVTPYGRETVGYRQTHYTVFTVEVV